MVYREHRTRHSDKGSATGMQKELYDAKVHGGEFKVGDLVWLHNPVVARGASHCPCLGSRT